MDEHIQAAVEAPVAASEGTGRGQEMRGGSHVSSMHCECSNDGRRSGGTGGILAVCIAKFREFFKASGLNQFVFFRSLFYVWGKGEIRCQQARREIWRT